MPSAPVTPPPASQSPPIRATGFAAFAGTGSPFTTSPFSSNALATSSDQQRPAWSCTGNALADPPSSALSDPPVAAAGPTNDAPQVEHVAVPNPNDVALAAVETRVKTTVTRQYYYSSSLIPSLTLRKLHRSHWGRGRNCRV